MTEEKELSIVEKTINKLGSKIQLLEDKNRLLNELLEAQTLINEQLTKQLNICDVGCSEITTNDYGKEFVIIRDDLVEIEKGSVVVLLEINSNGRHEFMDEENDIYYFEADCVERK